MPIPRRLPINDTTTKKKVIKNPPKVEFDDDDEIEEMEELENEELDEVEDEDVVDEIENSEDDEDIEDEDIDDSEDDDEEEDEEDEDDSDEDDDYEEESDDEETVEDTVDDSEDDDSDEEDEEDEEEEDEEEEAKPAPRKVNKKSSPAKKTTAPKNSKTVSKKTVETKKDTSKTSKTVKNNKKTVKPAAKAEKEETTKKASNKNTDIIHKVAEEGVSNFIEVMKSGKYNNDFDGKTSATRDDLARQVMGKIFEAITDDESKDGSRLKKVINFNNLNLASTNALISMVEAAMMDFIYSQYTFVFGWNEDGNRKSFRRAVQVGRTLDGIKEKTGKIYYVKPYPKMKLEFNVGLEKVEGTDYDKNTRIFTDLDGNEINIDEENEKFKKEDAKRFPRNYPPHLMKNKPSTKTTSKTTKSTGAKKKTVKK